jgi:hypothetical protein
MSGAALSIPKISGGRMAWGGSIDDGGYPPISIRLGLGTTV